MSRSAVLVPTAPPELSLEEWFELPEEASGELVDGRLEEEEVPDFVHEFLVGLLSRLLGNWVIPLGGVLGGSEAKFAVGQQRGRKPDLTVYLAQSTFPRRRGLVDTPPDIVVEVISPKPRDIRRDRVEKLADYAAFGVRWYWLVDPELESFEILELGADSRYVHALGASRGRVDSVPGCPGLFLDLDELWDTLARLPLS